MPKKPTYGEPVKRIEGGQGFHREVGPLPKSRAPEHPSVGRLDHFGVEGAIPRFLRSVQKRLDSSHVYQSFKLPGTSYVVQDRRGETIAETPPEEKNSAFEVKDGRIITAKEKSYVNYLGEKQFLQGEVFKPLVKEILRLLSEFEKLLVERFEKGRTIERLLRSDD